MKIGYIGLGKMGKNMVLRLLEHNIEVVAWNRSPEPLNEVSKVGAIPARDLKDLISKLESPRVIWVMVSAGEVFDDLVSKFIGKLTPGDLIIDGGNSYYKDSIRRGKEFIKRGIHFMDIGTSGGPEGSRNGACLMIGGDRKDYTRIIKLIKAISAPDAYQYLGPVGSGHFVKMIHNGIEYGMMQAIGEGFALLKYSDFKINVLDAARIYQHRSVIESRLVGWLEEALRDDVNLTDISSKIDATGEGEWTAKTAKEMKINVPIIAGSVKVRSDSVKDVENSGNGFRNKVVSAMRGKFGQHAVLKT